jgi:hypothetical protein
MRGKTIVVAGDLVAGDNVVQWSYGAGAQAHRLAATRSDRTVDAKELYDA